jgi:uncharacterized protein HemX
MKKILAEEDHAGLWIAAAITGALAAGAGIWFYLRGKRAAEAEAYRHEHAQDYLHDKQHKKKKHKTTVSELENLVDHPQS